jgi:hypothetical protein
MASYTRVRGWSYTSAKDWLQHNGLLINNIVASYYGALRHLQ